MIKSINVEFTKDQMEKFDLLTKYLLEENEKYNLTAITNPDEIYEKHYVDSAVPLYLLNIPESSMIIDIGAGAGFPSLPLYIMRPDLNILMIDGTGKKINFINNAVNLIYGSAKTLPLAMHKRAEELSREPAYKNAFDYAVSRAVGNISVLCKYSLPFLKSGGSLIIYKGKKGYEELLESRDLLKKEQCIIEKCVTYNLSSAGYDNIQTFNNIFDNNSTEYLNNADYNRMLIIIKKKSIK